jgi:hypothetical protein
MISISRVWAMPNKNTFEVKPIGELIARYLKQLPYGATVVDPYANKCTIKSLTDRADLRFITNDIDPHFDTDYHMDAIDFLSGLDTDSADLVLWDPPFSPRQVSECYKKFDKTVDMQTTQASFWSKQKEEISRITKADGLVIGCGWNSGGVGTKYGFDITEILLVPHGGWHNDTIVTVSKNIRGKKQ